MTYPIEFWKDVHEVRSQVGLNEYDRADLEPDIMDLIRKHNSDEEGLLRNAARKVLDTAERSEERKTQAGLFPDDAHMALGDGKRIRRDCATLEHHQRRKSVIDDNLIAQQDAWKRETQWLNDGIQALRGHAPTTVRKQVLTSELEPAE